MGEFGIPEYYRTGHGARDVEREVVRILDAGRDLDAADRALAALMFYAGCSASAGDYREAAYLTYLGHTARFAAIRERMDLGDTWSAVHAEMRAAVAA